MPLCSICLNREATQTGSHLLSAFMVESTIGKRGEEEGYLINSAANFDYRNNTGAGSVIEDYLFCRGCEQRMAYVENYVSTEYRDKFKNPSFKNNFSDIVKDHYIIQEALNINYYAFLLFICTVIFRISITNKELFAQFRLTEDEEEKLRNIINEALPLYQNFKVKIKRSQFIREINKKSSIFEGLYFVICSYQDLEDETKSFNMAYPIYRQPYNFIFGQSLLYFFFIRPRKNVAYLDFFQLLPELDIELMYNGEGANVKTVILKEERWKEILEIPKKQLVREKIPGLMSNFLSLFRKANKREPNNADWEKYVDENFK
ncbi:hypothetical protein [Pedobacter gandavensis]|uniref:hypothetical protein n=1 Tax=Pedobacter gandavensis TaxID=2679963 RepID=UPI00292F4618|nr:hypothetical protein [Pedobacter gandavensis]